MLLATAGQKLSRKKPHDNPHVAEPIDAMSWPSKNCRCVDIGKLRPAMLDIPRNPGCVAAARFAQRPLVSNLTTTNHTFTLTYKKGNTMTVDFSKAVVKGSLANDAWAEVKLYGYDDTSAINPLVLASRVEVEYECTEPYDHKKEMNTED